MAPFDFRARFLRQENSGPAKARNQGAAHALGEWLVFLDDDCVPRPDWLQHFDNAARQHPAALLGGSTRNACPDNVFAETNQRLVDFVVRWFEKTNSAMRFFASNNFAVPSASFRDLGGFDVTFPIPGGEDREFCARWLASGREMLHVPAAWIDHYHPQSFTKFLEMHYRYGRGAALFHQRRKTSPAAVSSASFYQELFRAFWSADRKVTNTTLVALTQAAAAAGFAKERLKPSNAGGHRG